MSGEETPVRRSAASWFTPVTQKEFVKFVACSAHAWCNTNLGGQTFLTGVRKDFGKNVLTALCTRLSAGKGMTSTRATMARNLRAPSKCASAMTVQVPNTLASSGTSSLSKLLSSTTCTQAHSRISARQAAATTQHISAVARAQIRTQGVTSALTIGVQVLTLNWGSSWAISAAA